MTMQAFRLFSSILVLFLGSVLLAGCQSEAPPQVRADSDDTMTLGTVQLAIDFDGQHEPVSLAVPCSANSTVLTVLQRAQEQGDLKFQSYGSGPAAFVESIEGIKNAGGNGKNWVFRINGIMANLGSGAFRVSPGDEVSWEFSDYSPE